MLIKSTYLTICQDLFYCIYFICWAVFNEFVNLDNYKDIDIDTRLQSNPMLPKVLPVFFILFALSQTKPLKPVKIIKAINCGLKQGSTKGQGDFKYENDQAYVSGSSVDVDYHSDSGASGSDIKFTIEKEIYMFERHTYSQMTYSLPVKTGKHTIILKFAQMYFEKSGQRVFDIKIGDNVVIQNMDVIQKSGGKYAAHEEYIEIQVKDAAVYHNSIKLKNGLKGGNLQLSFVKGKADNPIIQAIVVYHGPVSQTTKQDYDNLKKNWGSHQQMLKAKKQNQKIKQMIAMTKKKQRIVIRNDQLLIEEPDHSHNEQAVKREKFGFFRSLLMSPIGILIWTAVIAFKIYFVYNRVFLMGKSRSGQPVKND